MPYSFIHSFIHSDPLYSAYSCPLLLRSATDTARILCRSFTPKRHRQLRVKDFPKVPTWRLERDSNPRLSGRKISTQIMRNHVPRRGTWWRGGVIFNSGRPIRAFHTRIIIHNYLDIMHIYMIQWLGVFVRLTSVTLVIELGLICRLARHRAYHFLKRRFAQKTEIYI